MWLVFVDVSRLFCLSFDGSIRDSTLQPKINLEPWDYKDVSLPNVVLQLRAVLVGSPLSFDSGPTESLRGRDLPLDVSALRQEVKPPWLEFPGTTVSDEQAVYSWHSLLSRILGCFGTASIRTRRCVLVHGYSGESGSLLRKGNLIRQTEESPTGQAPRNGPTRRAMLRKDTNTK